MSASTNSTGPWTPVSTEDRELVLKELDSILASHHFRGSKRYPAFLKYVVEAALENRLGDLKERTLGVEVFGRDPGYDTNADPVVRVSAGEVRKRIAQYYHENGNSTRVQIELPLGSYAPEFLLCGPDAADRDAEPEPLTSSERTARSRRALIRAVFIGLAAALLVGGGIAGYLYHEALSTGEAATLNLWNPLFKATQPVLIVLGTTHPSNMRPLSQETTFSDHVTNPYQFRSP
jgi:hypothetical protein